jgi:4-hydroxy-tetrahydrodipicolinate synthase
MTQLNPHSLAGVSTALITPFDQDNRLDLDALSHMIAMQKQGGASAILVLGSTGESPTIGADERLELVKQAKTMADDRMLVIAGAGSNCTRSAIELQKAVEEAGADVTMQVVPYYNKPTEDGLFGHFSAIAREARAPIIIYNNPGRTACDLKPATMVKLIKAHTNIVAIKDANTNLERLAEMVYVTKNERSDFLVLGGEDSQFFPLLALGGDGNIAVSSQLALFEMNAIYQAMKNGDHQYAAAINHKLAGFYDLTFCHTNPLPMKTMLSTLGVIKNNYRLPLCPLNAEQEKALVTRFKEFAFLKAVKSTGVFNE